MNKFFKIIEKIFPYIVAIVLFFILKKLFKESSITINLIGTVFESIFSIATTLVGFFITTLTIFITFAKSQIMQHLRKSNLLHRVLTFFYEVIIIGLLLIGVIIFLMINIEENNTINTNYFIFGISMFVLFLCSILRAVSILFIVFNCALEDPSIIENCN